MNTKYKTVTVLDPITSNPTIKIFYDKKSFINISITMSKQDAKTFPFSNKENFETDWTDIIKFLKRDLKRRVENSI